MKLHGYISWCYRAGPSAVYLDSCDTAKSKPKVLFVVQASMPGKLKAFVQREGHVMTRVQWEKYDRKELDKLDWSQEALEDYVTRQEQ
jgi:hypothetical protein